MFRSHEPDKGTWNYVGDGINGGARVIESIGKDADDIVFVSDKVRNEILNSDELGLGSKLQNRGRRSDKHGKMLRVYELEHANIHQPW